jgi:C_GCAxxG_C_C family probable redox protein
MEEMMRMLELSLQGCPCSQILIMMGLEAQGKSNPDLVHAVRALGMGIGGTGKTCGALTGGACLLGLYAGQAETEGNPSPHLDDMVAELVHWFEEEYGESYGSIDCDHILQGDPTNKKSRCPTIVSETYEKVKEILSKYDFDFYAEPEA